jgi:hypothetical protein
MVEPAAAGTLVAFALVADVHLPGSGMIGTLIRRR